MSNITAPATHESSFSRRHFNWIISRVEDLAGGRRNAEDEEILAPANCSSDSEAEPCRPPRGPLSRIRSALRAAISGRAARPTGLGSRVIGTIFGPRRGHVRFAIQGDPRARPALLVELDMPTASLIKEMASGLVRVALECERKSSDAVGCGKVARLVEERVWRAYCNGRKCGYALKRDCGAGDTRVLRAVEPVSMGAGVLPPEETEEGRPRGEGEMMYMRARFERVVGSKDSEALYMMNPDGKGGGPELSIYLLRV
ncbi:hypothetical protein HPP92_008026 [Vanilla planifolia]|uniref:Protein MIZU-KUSSEI 1 n=1 Tax=Vanilla planifolia TaxID=51239 RepID=A0A835RS25_VANPL|nr:hypothetical protein HPP92_008026 [Vanilla planifolia]